MAVVYGQGRSSEVTTIELLWGEEVTFKTGWSCTPTRTIRYRWVSVSVGHAAVLHGCTIGNGTLVGIHATILNDAVIGRNCIVAAGAVIPEGKHFPDRSLILGAPAKVVRQLSDDEIANVLANAEEYVTKASVFQAHLK